MFIFFSLFFLVLGIGVDFYLVCFGDIIAALHYQTHQQCQHDLLRPHNSMPSFELFLVLIIFSTLCGCCNFKRRKFVLGNLMKNVLAFSDL